MNFKWLIVDDGSSDNTKEIVDGFIEEDKISIQYIYQENQGKMQAMNTAVAHCDTELFLICDSDDSITEKGIEYVKKCWNSNKNDKIAGIVAYRNMRNADELFGIYERRFTDDIISERLTELMKPRVFDTTQIYRTDIMRNYPFPQYQGENFVPEMAIWKQIDLDYEVLILREVIEEGEYQQDGYTKGKKATIKNNPMGYGYLFYINYLYEKKYGIVRNRLKEVGKLLSTAFLAKDHSLARNVKLWERIIVFPVGIIGLLKWK